MKNKIKALIVDDEPLSREKIRILAELSNSVEIIGEAKNFSDAQIQINKLKPDILFLDINMPGKTGIELVSELGEKAPFIIFTTAHSDYAVEAFNLNAIHYLLKPFDQQKFNEAVDRVMEKLTAKKSGRILNEIQTIISLKQNTENYPERIPVKVNEKIILIFLNEITFIESDKNYAILTLKEKEYRMRTTLNEIAKKLNPDLFVRVHKSFIVNRIYVQELEPTFNQEFIIKLNTGKKIPTGKAFKENVAKILM